MAGTRNRGPYVALGPLLGTAAPDPYDGPSLYYQGTALLDPRYAPANKDSQSNALFPAWLDDGEILLTNVIPSAAGTATVAAGQNAVSVTALGFVTTAPGSANGGVPSFAKVPLIPFQGSGAPIQVYALDFGFTTGTTSAGSPTIASIPDSSIFKVGQWICVGGSGTSNLSAQIVQVSSILTAQSILVSANMVAALTGAPIGSANQYNVGGFVPNPGQQVANAVMPYWAAGEALLYNPNEGCSRALSITTGASGSGGTFIVAGYDVYGVSMHETIVAGTQAVTTYGKKAFKYLVSITPQFADAHNYYVGTSDVYGFALNSGTFEKMRMSWAGTAVTAKGGWTAGLSATFGTATFTTADVRGTLQTSANGGGASSVGSTTSDGSAVRLSIGLFPSVQQTVLSTNTYTVPLLGLPQV